MAESVNNRPPRFRPSDAAWLVETAARSGRVSEARQRARSYDIFRSPKERRDLYLVGRNMSEYVREEGVKAVYFMDRSARPAHVAMKTYWNIYFPESPIPHIGFLNPRGFVSQEDVDKGIVFPMTYTFNDRSAQNSREALEDIRPESEIVNDLRGELIAKDLHDQLILLFDTCVHSGESVRPMIDKFRKAGADNVKFGVVSANENMSGIRPDFTVMDKAPTAVCYPFGRDPLTTKIYGDIHNASNVTPRNSQYARLLREEIKMAVEEFADVER